MPQKITIDGQLEISVGASRNSTNWKVNSLLWSELAQRLSTTHHTHETQAEYAALPTKKQDEIKDIGGFVGGYMIMPNRKKGSVLNRQIITLDVDHGNADIWKLYTSLYSNAAVLYSTHKHKPDAPRLRLVIPLDRPAMAEEYEAIARKIAGTLGIESFDRTTFQMERLMYWPSTSKDGEYRYEVQDGDWLSADDVLRSYRDWRNTAEWPASVKDTEALHREIKRLGDPLEKKGHVGAFCRVYSITDVINTYLSNE